MTHFLKKNFKLFLTIIITLCVILFLVSYPIISQSIVAKYNGYRFYKMIINNWKDTSNNQVTINNKEKKYPGYTLISSFSGHSDSSGTLNQTILIDDNGNIVHEWAIAGFPPRLLPGGNLLGNDTIVNGRDDSNKVVELDWSGNKVWEFSNWEKDDVLGPISRSHHDIQRQDFPGGFFSSSTVTQLSTSSNTLILSRKSKLDRAISYLPIEDDVILEVNRKGEIIWKWTAADHFSEFGFSDLQKTAIFTASIVAIFGKPGTNDWLHINYASYLGENKWFNQGDNRFNPDNIIISSRNGCFIAIIDKITGKIIWQLGPDYNFMSTKKIGQIIGQHNTYIIPQGLPGGGNLMVYDNGGASCFGSFLGVPVFPSKFRDYSRILEINPATLDVVWEYSQPSNSGNNKFASFLFGSAQRLPNGNTLITEGLTGRIFEVTHDGEIVWEFYSAFTDKKIIFSGYDWSKAIYNAFRVPKELLPNINQTNVEDK